MEYKVKWLITLEKPDCTDTKIIKMKSGVYEIINTKNNKKYIGSSKNVKERIINHKSLLKNNNHHSIHLQRAYNKDKEYFKFNIIKYCENYIEEEQILLDNLQPEYNIKKEAINGFYGEHSKDTIRKIKLKKARIIAAFNKDGKIICNFLGIQDACKYFNIKRGVVHNCLKKKQYNKNGNLAFLYRDDYIAGIKPTKFIKTFTKKPGIKGITLFVYLLSGKFLKKYESIQEASKKLGISASNIHRKINKIPKWKSKRSHKYLYFNQYKGKYLCKDIV